MTSSEIKSALIAGKSIRRVGETLCFVAEPMGERSERSFLYYNLGHDRLCPLPLRIEDLWRDDWEIVPYDPS
ncbi:MAG: hypothetical protein ACYCR5_04435 [Leptospirillum sp.]